MKERYELTIEANADMRPAATRLKGLLKLALRGFGFRCVTVREVASETHARCMSQNIGMQGTALGVARGERDPLSHPIPLPHPAYRVL